MPTGYDLNIHKMNIQIIADRHHHIFTIFTLSYGTENFFERKKPLWLKQKGEKKQKIGWRRDEMPRIKFNGILCFAAKRIL